MAEVAFDVPPATPQKRTHDNCIVVSADSTANIDTKSSSTEQQSTSTRASPAPSSASSLTDLTSSNGTPRSAVKTSSTVIPPIKKRKLGYIEKEAEKAAKAREKEEKARAKAGEKARKDEEKRKAAEEKENVKRAKELDKAEKQAALEAEKKEREAKKAAKEAEKKERDAQKQAEKLRKERSQMRLGVFFGKPKPESTPPSTPDVSDGASSRRSSIASIDMERPVLEPKDTTTAANPDYEKWILPFFVPEYTDVAPYNRFKLSRKHDFEVTADSQATVCDVTENLGRPRKRMKRTIPVKEIINNIQASDLDLIDLDSAALHALGQTSYKYLQFQEDVRPPYQGTFSRLISPRLSRKISRNPFTRGLPDKNYDYDSEAEWEPPGEDDEELNDDDEMSVADDAEDEMADFLDDEDDTARRKGPLSDMEPISSGLCWVGEAFDDRGANLQQYRMGFLHDSTEFPIDPFSTKHWIEEVKPKAALKADPNTLVMQPPRNPLASLSPNTMSTTKQEVGVDGKPVPPLIQKNANSSKTLRMIEPEYLVSFKKAVDGSDLTKAGLIEILKKQFPKCSKDAIKDTLGAVAKREGKKEVDKKWCLLEHEQSK